MFVWLRKFIKREKFIFGATLIVFITCIAVAIFAYQNIKSIEIWYFNKQTEKVKYGLRAEADYVFKHVKELADSQALLDAIKARDTHGVAIILKHEQQEYALTALLVTDSSGLVLARTKIDSHMGDYIFLTTPYGRSIMRGQPGVSIERGTNLPLMVVAGYPINDHGLIVGAVFGGYSIDDGFAQRFSSKYLKEQNRVLFYSKQEGVAGTNFQNTDNKKLIRESFNAQSDWIQNKLSDKEVLIGGETYLAKNISLRGLEGSAGGMIMFYHTGYKVNALLYAFIVSFIFFVIIYNFYITVHASKRRRIMEAVALVICTLIVFLWSFGFNTYIFLYNSKVIKQPVYKIYNSTIGLWPSYGIWNKAFEQHVSVKVSTGGEAINAVQANLNFDPKKIQVLEADTTNSFCDSKTLLEKTIDNKAGYIKIACVRPNFTALGDDFIVVDLVVQPIQAGRVALNFTDDTQVLANDGLGTNVLRSIINANFSVIDPQTIVNKNTKYLAVFSPSAPNITRWYNISEVILLWQSFGGSSYQYSLDRSQIISDFSNTQTTIANSVVFRGLTDGIYYFHIAAINGVNHGVITTYPIMIDTTPPKDVFLKSSDTVAKSGQLIRLEFGGRDEASGLLKYNYIKFDNGAFLPTNSPLFIQLPIGSHTITARVFDKADNFTDVSLPIRVVEDR